MKYIDFIGLISNQMTQEGQFSPPVQDNSSSTQNNQNPQNNQANVNKGVFGAGSSTSDGNVVDNNIPPIENGVKIEDNSSMPDFGIPHDSSSDNTDIGNGVFGGPVDNDVVNEDTSSTTDLDINDTSDGYSDNNKQDNNTLDDIQFDDNLDLSKENNNIQNDNNTNNINVEKNIVSENKNSENDKKIENNTNPVSSIENKVNSANGGEDKRDIIVKKYNQLFDSIQNIYNLKNITDESSFEVIGSDNDTMRIVYSFSLELDDVKTIIIKRKETNLKTSEEKENLLELEFDIEDKDVLFYLDDDLLFDTMDDLFDNSKYTAQVIEKLDKFQFLLDVYTKKLNDEIKAKEETEKAKKQMMLTFKTF